MFFFFFVAFAYVVGIMSAVGPLVKADVQYYGPDAGRRRMINGRSKPFVANQTASWMRQRQLGK